MQIFSPHHRRWRILAAVCLLPAASFGATSSQTVLFPDTGGGTFYDSDSPGSPGTGFTDTVPLTGFNQFDPALGTLNEVRIRLGIDASWDLFAEVDPDFNIIDPGSTFAIDFATDSFIEAGIFYQPTGANILISAAVDAYFDPFQLFFIGDIDNPSDGDGDSFGELNLSGSETTGSLFPGINNFNSADFVGTGTVQGLELGFFVPLDDFWFTENLNSATVELTYSLAATEVTIDYLYDPIPEPSSFLLLAAGLGLITRRRR